ncbi:MAG: DUF3305 domain-containing protein [Piscinibacter sp.]|uniref:DUF3305 domain-containing protein n=1 Tax=Piscinibacter TaxID=1114981 RepID=UPI000FDD4794|nr:MULTISPECIES: DUF3305 domain-containing protein [Piscinibacter]MCW5662236.1 DUF3305 domain-containing protein [Piscinibacter sp.]
MAERPSVTVAVVMEREAQPNRWEDWRHRIVEVVPMQPGFGDAPRVLRDDGGRRRTLHPGFDVTLYADEGEGYFLNLSSGAPVWFVVWRVDDEDPSRAWPEQVTLSYNEAGRRMDAQERVDNAPLQPQWRDWLQAFTELHYRPEPKQRKRPASFRAPGER